MLYNEGCHHRRALSLQTTPLVCYSTFTQSSLMAAQIGTPPNVTDADRVDIFTELDSLLNSQILYSLLLGLYTGIIAVTLGSIFTNKSRPVGRGMVFVILLLHILTFINFFANWLYIRSTFISNGWGFWAEYLFYRSPGIKLNVVIGIAGAICTVLADSTMIWRCWIVWGRRWPVILPPVLFLISAVVFRTIATYKIYINASEYNIGVELSSAFVLATTLWCTLLIVYRIVTIVRAGGAQAGGGLRAYRHVLEVFVESSALYSLSLILYVAVLSHDTSAWNYIDTMAATARGIAPTLLVGRVAAGHARPDDSWQGNIASSLRFGTHPRGQGSQQDSSATSDDLEAQLEGDGEYSHPTSIASTTDDGLVHQDNRETHPEGLADDSDAITIVPRD
ncbi:hypothetical protein DFS33DRAFT_1308554 [Desarmillaria ectypa]|nr:hypothetical protein DFS33DRAFT_1308554 [Desarmillaria ectypa]